MMGGTSATSSEASLWIVIWLETELKVRERLSCAHLLYLNIMSENELTLDKFIETLNQFAVRAFPVREVHSFLQETTLRLCLTVDGQQRCKVAVQTNNVEVDERGFIYIVDRASTGLHILELTGSARNIAQFP